MWNCGKHIIWQPISDLYYRDLGNGGKTVPKLIVDHVKLNPYSKMSKVKFVAQVLSETVSRNSPF